MKKTTKGALAAGSAAVLLMGGVGTLAYWTDSENVSGGTINSGQLDLGTANCGTGWKLDGGAVYTNQLLVPGDSLTKTCTIDLVAKGTHIGADLAVSTPAWAASNALTAQLTPSATFTVNGVTKTHVTDLDDTGTAEIVATIQVDFNGTAATNASQNLTATLNTISVSATQNHDPS